MYVLELKYLDTTTAEIKFLTKLEDCCRKYVLLKHWGDQGLLYKPNTVYLYPTIILMSLSKLYVLPVFNMLHAGQPAITDRFVYAVSVGIGDVCFIVKESLLYMNLHSRQYIV
jgi:hypothetical protein